MPRIEANVTPSIMKWARETAKILIPDAAKKIGRSEEELVKWESGELKPTIPQARKAAEVYKRSLAVFYLNEIPTDFDTIRDFRKLPSETERDFSNKLSILIRITQNRQDWTKTYCINEKFPELEFVNSASIVDNPRILAKKIRETLNIEQGEIQKLSSKADAVRYWIKQTEKAGIYVFRDSSVELIEARGFLLSDNIAPFICINSKDSYSGQLFTLCHELAHLWLGLSGISNYEISGTSITDKFEEIEVFCNAVSSNLLLVPNLFNDEFNKISLDSAIEEKILRLSIVFKTSEEAIARRMLDNGIISKEDYLQLRKNYNERWLELKKAEKIKRKQRKGGPSYYVTTLSKNGYSFTRTVLNSHREDLISSREASSLLNVKVNNLQKLGETAGIYHIEQGIKNAQR